MGISIVKLYKYRDTNELVAADTYINGTLVRLARDKVISFGLCGSIDNAVLCTNGVIRAKRGHLNVEYIDRNTRTTDMTAVLDNSRNSKVYDGNTPKFGVTLKNKNYIVKMPKRASDNSTISEYVASQFMHSLGYNAHNTVLTQYKGLTVVLMEDFTDPGEELRSYEGTRQSREDTDISNKEYSYKDITYMIKKQSKLSGIDREAVLRQFWDMYLLDAVLANRDRHKGNWGYLTNGSKHRVAKIYDNGGSLFHDVVPRINMYKADRKQFLSERCERFPASLLLRNGKRTNYYEIVGEIQFRNATSEISNKYSFEAYTKLASMGGPKIFNAASKVVKHPLIDVTLQNFYRDTIFIRYSHIILRHSFEESYKELLKLCKE